MTASALRLEIERVAKRNNNEKLLVLADVSDAYYSVIGVDEYNDNVYLLLSGREIQARTAMALAIQLVGDGQVYIRKGGDLFAVLSVWVDMRTYLILKTVKIG